MVESSNQNTEPSPTKDQQQSVQQNENFFVSDEWINDKLLYAKELKDEDVKVELKTENADKQDILGFVTCCVCQNVAWNPKQCDSKCASIFCKTCIEKWWENSDKRCPACRMQTQIKEVDNTVTKLLANLRFKCEKREQCEGDQKEFDYRDAFKHYKVCNTFAGFNCFNSCSALYKTKEQWKQHLSTNCHLARVTCKKCKTWSRRYEVSTHDCLSGLNAKN